MITKATQVLVWPVARRVAFRFVAVYLSFYLTANVLWVLPITYEYAAGIKTWYDRLWLPVVAWTGRHVLRLPYEISALPGGSNDTTFDYVQLLLFAVVAGAVTVAWSVADRHSRGYEREFRWAREELRYILSLFMLSFGVAKLVGGQFPPLEARHLVGTYGESSPMGLLWRFMGFSYAYTAFTGLAEILGGLLLLFRRTTTLGALVSFGVLINVVMLNFSYDVPLKLVSTHLAATAVIIALPDLPNLVAVLVSHRAVTVSPDVLPLDSPRAGAARLLVAVGFVGLTIASQLSDIRSVRALNAPATQFVGVWDVDGYTRTGRNMSPAANDSLAWRRVTFGSFGSTTVRLVSDSTIRYRSMIDTLERSWRLIASANTTDTLRVAYMFVDANRLVLRATRDGDSVRVGLRRLDTSNFLLMSRGFHWINEVPLSR